MIPYGPCQVTLDYSSSIENPQIVGIVWKSIDDHPTKSECHTQCMVICDGKDYDKQWNVFGVPTFETGLYLGRMNIHDISVESAFW
jgi:hypothetical protein